MPDPDPDRPRGEPTPSSISSRLLFRRDSRAVEAMQPSIVVDGGADSDNDNDKAVEEMELNMLRQQQDETNRKLDLARAEVTSLTTRLQLTAKSKETEKERESVQKSLKTATARVAKYERRQLQTEKSIADLQQPRPKRTSHVNLSAFTRRREPAPAIAEDQGEPVTGTVSPPDLLRRQSNISLPAVVVSAPTPPDTSNPFFSTSTPTATSSATHAPVPTVSSSHSSTSASLATASHARPDLPPRVSSVPAPAASAAVPLQLNAGSKKRPSIDPQRSQNELDILQLAETTAALSDRITSMAAANSELLQTIQRLREKAESRDAEIAALKERLKNKEDQIDKILSEQRSYVVGKVKAVEAQADQSRITVQEMETKIVRRHEQLANQQGEVARHIAMIDQINDTLGPKPVVWKGLRYFLFALFIAFLAVLVYRYR